MPSSVSQLSPSASYQVATNCTRELAHMIRNSWSGSMCKFRSLSFSFQIGGRAPSPHPTPAVTREHWEEELLSRFFDAEVAFERRKSICRDEICTEPEKEIAYLGELSEVLLYLIMPEDDFPCKPLRYLLRELLIHSVFLPTIDLLSDPDYLNQTIIWLCKGVPMTSDAFLTSIRVNTCPDEIDALLEKINAEITFQRSRDSGGDSDTEVKQQLSSLLYLKRCAEARKRALKQRETGVSPGLRPADLLDIKLPDLSLTQILGNNIALSYFSEFLDGVGGKHLMALLLNIECWRVTAEQTIQAVELAQLSSVQEGAGDETSKVSRLDQAARRAELEPLRVPALMIFEHYLSEAANPRVRLNDDVVRDLHYSLKTEIPSENWFNVIVALLREKFGRSSLYIALLEELDLLRLDQAARGSDDEDQGLPEEVDLRSSSSSLASFGSQAGPVEPGWQLSIESLRINSRGSKQFALYKVVGRRILPGREEIIDPVFRRYSDFYDFHQLVISKYPDLSGLYFPEKKAFNNLDSDFLRARRSQLDQYLRILVSPAILSSHPKLQDMICAFLECEGYVHRGMVTKILDPLKTSVRSVGSVVRLGASALTFEDGFFRVLSKGVLPGRDDQPDGPLSRLQSGTQEFEETIPLRILTLVLDEVFEVRTRDQLLRSYLVDAAKGFIKAMFGDVYNRRILEFVDWLTSAEQVKEYLKAFNGSPLNMDHGDRWDEPWWRMSSGQERGAFSRAAPGPSVKRSAADQEDICGDSEDNCRRYFEGLRSRKLLRLARQSAGDNGIGRPYSNEAMEALNSLRQKTLLCDAVLRTEDGGEFPIHRAILTASSSYFKALFTSSLNQEDKRDVLIPGITAEYLDLIIDYAYSRQTRINEENVTEVLVAADQYGVEGMIKDCTAFIGERINAQNCFGILNFARSYFCETLEKMALKYIMKYFPLVAEASDEFLAQPIEVISAILDSETLNIRNEEIAWEAALKWIKHDETNRKRYVVDLLKTIRLGLLDSQYFVRNVKNHECYVSVVLLNGYIYAMGGYDGHHRQNTCEKYDPATNQWSMIATMINQRSDASATTLNAFVDPAGARAYHGLAVIKNCIYVIGGFDGMEYFNSCRKFDAVTKIWSEIAPMNCRRLEMQCVCKIYITGGFNGQECLASAEVYDPVVNMWSAIPQMGSRRSGVSCIAHRDKIYVLGGFNGQSRLCSGERFDLTENEWSPIPDMYHPRSNFAIERFLQLSRHFSQVIDDLIFAIGGFNGVTTIYHVECFDERTNEW
ncbi:unnamed protein product [Cyprideis torosa]|uniref:Uncharacterized protein n=1 Tax=Cyprideis torosa TaxID=163714 RepID=A0A7R8ZHZ1_9CRUS|nr:unnamed protein product [Cyprideis torosa]CAG0884895.1 unnamed protein product [Cyprideis torosa]